MLNLEVSSMPERLRLRARVALVSLAGIEIALLTGLVEVTPLNTILTIAAAAFVLSLSLIFYGSIPYVVQDETPTLYSRWMIGLGIVLSAVGSSAYLWYLSSVLVGVLALGQLVGIVLTFQHLRVTQRNLGND